LSSSVIFDDKDKDYCLFKPVITDRGQIREIVDNHPALAAENKRMDAALEAWWEAVRAAIETMPHHNHVAKFRRESIDQLKKQLAATSILDEFQRAGVFVNWWEAVRWDMKAIVATGWTPSLIPDDYIQSAFFKKELDELDATEAKIAEGDSELSEIVDEIEMDENGEEENGKTVKSVKSYLKEQIATLEEAETDSASKEKAVFEAQLQRLEVSEKELKKAKKTFKEQQEYLRNKVEAKRTTFTDAEATKLVLKKFHALARSEMYRYLNSEKRQIVGIFENLWDKYKLSATHLTQQRDAAQQELSQYLVKLHYLQ
jgi:type I restriction enzyme M protein